MDYDAKLFSEQILGFEDSDPTEGWSRRVAHSLFLNTSNINNYLYCIIIINEKIVNSMMSSSPKKKGMNYLF